MNDSVMQQAPLSRRRLLQTLGGLGVGSAVFGRALVAAAEGKAVITSEMLEQAAWVAGLELTPGERDLMLEGLGELADDYAVNRAFELPNSVVPAQHFVPLVERVDVVPRGPVSLTRAAPPTLPKNDADLAFAPVTVLSELLRTRRITSVDLTRLYLDRLRRFDSELRCVITLTEDLALRQAAKADAEIAAGHWRGPLHGVPWGAKDLLAVPGYPTTWGAVPYRDQELDEKATVVARLEDAGAVLVAKLTLGALAWGDVWFGGKTRNPWNLEQGSSGSSAGSASAVSAGLVGFAIGSETWGSIVSPCTRCGVTGLRPTFGRVSRHGAMALSWSMDKLGPIARSVEDCALVFHAVHGGDGLDPTACDAPFHWPISRDVRTLRVGYVPDLFEVDFEGADDPEQQAAIREWRDYDNASLDVLRGLGVEPIPIELPRETPLGSLALMLTAEAATAFDDLTRSGRDEELVRQVSEAWPNVFRQGQMIPAVEYLRASRLRTLLMREMEEKIAGVDVYVCPSYGGDNLLLTNLTGHPCVVLPNGFRASDGTPTSITFVGRLDADAEVLAVAHAWQQATDFHLRRPPRFG